MDTYLLFQDDYEFDFMQINQNLLFLHLVWLVLRFLKSITLTEWLAYQSFIELLI